MLKLLKSKKLLSASFIVLGSCRNLKPYPDVDTGTLIFRQDIEHSYGYFLSDKEESNREYRIPAEQLFRDKYICTSPEHYGERVRYIEYLKRQAQKRCK
jgi:chromosome segregation ATPase